MRYDLELRLQGPKSSHFRAVGCEIFARKPTPEAFAKNFAEFVQEVVKACVREDMEGAKMTLERIEIKRPAVLRPDGPPCPDCNLPTYRDHAMPCPDGREGCLVMHYGHYCSRCHNFFRERKN